MTLTGAGWSPGEDVQINAADRSGEMWTWTGDAVAAPDGTFTTSFTLPAVVIASYNVTATAPSGTATTTFTDSNITWHNTVTPQPTTAVTINYMIWSGSKTAPDTNCDSTSVTPTSFSVTLLPNGTKTSGGTIDQYSSIEINSSSIATGDTSLLALTGITVGAATGTVQAVGTCVAGPNGNTADYYLHYGHIPTADNGADTAVQGVAKTLALTFHSFDNITTGWGPVSTDSSPSHGTLGSFSAPSCTANSPTAGESTCTVTVSYTAGATYTGPDSFTWHAYDGFNNSNIATESLTVTTAQQTGGLTVSSASGTYGGTANLSATFSCGTNSASTKTISFSLNGNSVGTATTNGSGVATISGASLAGINAATYASGVSASFAGDSSCTSASGTAQLTVGKKALSITASSASLTYGDAAPSISPSYSGFITGDNAGNSLSTAPTCITAYSQGSGVAGSPYGSSCSGAVSANYAPGYVAGSVTVAKASSTTTVTCPSGPYTYNGSAQAPCSATVTGAGGLSLTPDPSYTDNTNAGTATASYTYGGDSDHTGSNDSSSFTIDPATADCSSVTGYVVTYDGNSHTATGSCLGVDNKPLDGLDVTASTRTNVATNYDAWSFSNPNYTDKSGLVYDEIDPADATIGVTGYSTTYDGNAHLATGSAYGVKGENLTSGLDLSSTSHANAGTYTDSWTFTAPNGNYNNSSGTVGDSIGKADPTIVVTPYNVTYNAADHTATGSATGVNSEPLAGLDVSGTTHKNAGDYSSDGWAFTDVTGNYNNASGTVHDAISKADATVNVTPYDVTYDGNAHTASGTATGVGGADLSSSLTILSSHTNAGTYSSDSWSFANANYKGQSGTITDKIKKADATITVTPYSVTYNGSAHTATGSAKGVDNTTLSGLDLSGTTHTNVGTYGSDGWTFTDATGNYNNASGTVSDSIAKADPTCSVNGYTVTYNGNAHTADGSCTGVGSDGTLSGLDLSGTTHTNANTYSDSWTFTDSTGNYNNASGSVTDKINKADASITVYPYGVTYDGNAHTATVTAVGAKGEDLSGYVDLSGTTHTHAGSYGTDAWSFSDPNSNYKSSSGTVSDSIAKADPTISVTPYNVTYDATAHTATGSATGVNSEPLAGLSLSGTTHTGAGDYSSDGWTFTDATGNYNNASGTVHDAISKADATVNVTPYDVTYDGNAHTASGTATGVGGADLSSSLTITSSHTNAGTYSSDSWSFANANYKGQSGTITDKIKKADATITVTPYSVTYNAAAHTATGSAKGVNNTTLSGLDLSGTTHTNVGTYGSDGWTFTDATGNYNNASGTVSDSIGPKTLSVNATNQSKTYDGTNNEPTPTWSLSGFAGTENATSAGVTGSPNCTYSSTPVNAGTYNGIISCDPNTLAAPNYVFATGTPGTLTINKANQTITFTSTAPSGAKYGDGPYTVTATASSGLTVHFTAGASGTCTAVDNGDGSATITITGGGTCTITASQAGDGNWNAAPNATQTFSVNARPANVAYIGQTTFVSSGASSTSVQATLSASVQSDAGSIARAKVSFYDLVNHKYLATNVPVSAVQGASTPTGTANTVVTLSTGQYGSSEYDIEVQLDTGDGSLYQNCQQLSTTSPCGTASPTSSQYAAAHAIVVAMIPSAPYSMSGGGAIPKLSTSAGKYGDATGASYSAAFVYNNKMTNPQGQVMIILNRADGVYYIKSNSINSLAYSFDATGKHLIGYMKASIYEVTSTGSIGVDGNVTLRIDGNDGNGGTLNGNPAPDQIGLTVLSTKDSALYYSNNWIYNAATAAYQTVAQTVGLGTGVAVWIGG